MAHATTRGAHLALSERPNRFPQGAPPSDLLYRILEMLVSERAAGLVAQLPIRPFSARKAARPWEAYDAIVRCLRALAPDETLLVQTGKPVGVFRTPTDAPRVLLANSNLVPRWATSDEFRRLEAKGPISFGQMTAGT